MLVNGFSGSQENVAGGPILRRGHLGFVSGSATRASLTDPSTPDGHVLSNGYFHRVVPNDNAQGAVDVAFMLKKLGIEVRRHGHDGRPGGGLLRAADQR